MAIAEFNERGGVLGRRLEVVHADTAGDPAVAVARGRAMIRQQEVAFLMGGVHSGVASAMSKVAQAHGCIYFNTNSSSPTEAGKDCHRTKFVWDGNGTNFSTSVVKGAMTGFGRDWVLITSDYLWGHNTAAASAASSKATAGASSKSSWCRRTRATFQRGAAKVRAIKPGVIATAVGGDDLTLLRTRCATNGMDRSFGWINNQQDWPDVYGLGREALFGIFGTTWYWGLGLAGVPEFVARYQQGQGDYRIKVPGNVFYNGYMATRELLRAIERTGSTNNLKLIPELETLRVPALDRMQHHDAYMNPQTHQLQQTSTWRLQRPPAPQPDDLFRILGRLQPDEVEDATAPSSASSSPTPPRPPTNPDTANPWTC
jgi:branched-chain amino acid transport system substrate-binding protein